MTTEEYNEEPVEYCSVCKSLHIVEENGDAVCMNCGSVNETNITTIENWTELYGYKTV